MCNDSNCIVDYNPNIFKLYKFARQLFFWLSFFPSRKIYTRRVFAKDSVEESDLLTRIKAKPLRNKTS